MINTVRGIVQILLATILVLSWTSCDQNSHNNSHSSSIDLPIYKNAYSIKRGTETSLKCSYLHYEIKINFPAEEVINYYDNAFAHMNFRNYSEDGYGMRRWENFNYSSGEWEPTNDAPARFIATWVDEKQKRRAVLSLGYEYKANTNKEWKNVLLVDCKVCPFFDFRKVHPPKMK
jgi:hypothetical protein